MHTINIHEAKTHLSRLVDQAVKGDSFIIAKAGKPLVKVTRLDAPSPERVKRLGFMAGQFPCAPDAGPLSIRASDAELRMGAARS
jgi:prevent-host-death family protein